MFPLPHLERTHFHGVGQSFVLVMDYCEEDGGGGCLCYSG